MLRILKLNQIKKELRETVDSFYSAPAYETRLKLENLHDELEQLVDETKQYAGLQTV